MEGILRKVRKSGHRVAIPQSRPEAGQPLAGTTEKTQVHRVLIILSNYCNGLKCLINF